MRVLVTGGAGYIGSHAVRELLNERYTVTVLDDLSNGHRAAIDRRAQFVQGSIKDYALVRETLDAGAIEAVMHFAGDIEVAESICDPLKYYLNNLSSSLNLIQAMRDAGVKKLVFSSTAAVYGVPNVFPIPEEHPRAPINPYGRSKMMTEMAIEDCSIAYDISFTVLRYFNVAGASPDGLIGEDHRPETHLIPRILAAALKGSEVRIFGTDYPTPDGTCVRDYLHVVDLARAHRLALESMHEREGRIFNLGSENGFSVKEVIAACQRVTRRQVKVVEEERRPGDPPMLIASSDKIKDQLGWNRIYPDLEVIIEHAWKWHSSHPHGYERGYGFDTDKTIGFR